MTQKRTPQQEADALRAVVIRQRTVLNGKCRDLEFYKSQYNHAFKLYELGSKNCDALANKVANLEEQLKDRHIRMRMAIAFMLSAIKDGYKFQDEEKEELFYEFCDNSGVNEQDREEFAQMQAQASK